MAGVLDKLRAKWDIAFGRYKVFFATEADHVRAAIEVLDEVRRKELNRVAGGSVVASHAFAGQELSYRLVACQDTKTGEIVGCVRITGALESSRIAASREEYRLDLFDEPTLARMVIFTRLAVLKAYRSTPASLVLLTQSFIAVLGEGAVAALFSCEPNLYPLYRRLGMQPLGPHHSSPSGGFRIPMICFPDRDYYREVDSPALPLLASLDYPAYEPIRRWYRETILGPGGPNLRFSLYQPAEDRAGGHRVLTEGLSPRGQAELLQNAVALRCRAGDVIIAEDDGGKAMGFVLRGTLGVAVRGRRVATIHEGELFGEIACVAEARRSAEVFADSDEAGIVLLSSNALQRLSDPRDQAAIWRTLARVVAQRLIAQTRPAAVGETAG